MKKLYFSLLILLFSLASFGQTLLYQEDFESYDGTNYFTSISEFTDNDSDFFANTFRLNIGSSYEVTGYNGSHYFAGQDIDGLGATLPVNLTTKNIDVTGQTSIDTVILIAEDDDGTNQDWDGSDYVHISYSIDGAPFVDMLWIESSITGTNGIPREDTNLDGVGDGVEITSTFQEFINTIPLSGASTIKLKIEFNLDSGDEDLAIDNIRVYDQYVLPPTITVGPAISGLDYEESNGPSAEDSFSVSGSNLTADITVTAPTNFEVSLTSGGTFTSSVVVPQTGGSASDVVYVRLVSGLAINAYSGDITASSTGATDKTIGLSGSVYAATTNSLVITGVYDGDLTGGLPKGIELYVINSIPDLSIFGLGSANNGGGTDGEEFTFPAVSATAGDYIYVASESPQFTNFFGFAPDYTGGAMGINGDDAVELFENGQVIDVFGDINTDGTGQAWDYEDGWAYRNTVGPSSTFVVSEWDYSGANALDGETTNASATTPFPIATYNTSVLSVVKNQIENFVMYPNPVSNGILYMSSSISLNKNVEIYSLTGQRVYSKNVQAQEPINILNLNKGIYLVKIEEAGKIATRKLVVN